jgi:hypothetical protein
VAEEGSVADFSFQPAFEASTTYFRLLCAAVELGDAVHEMEFAADLTVVAQSLIYI